MWRLHRRRKLFASMYHLYLKLASPLTIIERTREPDDIEAILKIAREREVERIIIGLPRLMNGDIGPQAKKVQTFTEAIRTQTQIPIEFRDERLTTVTAVRLKGETDRKKKNRKVRYDAMAAAVILQDYLEEKAMSKKPEIDLQ
jgi:putative Holliday junction resolvase